MTSASIVKLMQYIKFLKINYPPKLYSFLKAQKTMAGGLAFVPEISDEVKNKFSKHQLPKLFEVHKVHSSFLVGFWQPMISMLIILGGIIVLTFLEYSLKKYPKVYIILESVSVIVKWNFMITMFCSNYGDIAFYTSMEFRTIQIDSFFSALSFFVCLLVNTIAFFVILFIVKLNMQIKISSKQNSSTSNGKIQKEDPKEKYKQYKVLFQEFNDKILFQQVFTFIFIVKTYLNNMIIGFLDNSPVVQTTFMTILSIAMLIYLFMVHPMKKNIILIQQIFCEIILLVVNVCIFILSIMDAKQIKDYDTRAFIGNVVLMVNIIINWALTGFLVVKIILIIREQYLLRKAKKLKVEDSSSIIDQNLADQQMQLDKPKTIER